MERRPQAIIFDMDGVIVDSEPWWLVAMNQAFAQAGVQLEPDDFRQTTGLRLDEVIDYWYSRKKFKGTTPLQLGDKIYKEVLRLVITESGLMPGLRELLQELKSKNIPIGLASSSSQFLIDGIIEHFALKSYFDVVMSAEHFDYGKPHPEVFLKTAQKLGVANNTKCIVIEDSLNGIVAARAARMPCVALPDPEKKELMQFSLAQKIIGSLHELNNDWYSELID